MGRPPKPAFTDASTLMVGAAVETSQGIGEIAEIGWMECGGHSGEGARVTYPFDPTLRTQRHDYVVFFRNGGISSAQMRVVDSGRAKKQWEEIFAILQGDKGLKKMKLSATLNQYAEVLRDGDLKNIARLAVTLRETLVDATRMGTYPEQALAAKRLLAQRLALNTKRPEAECALHIVNALSGAEKKPMAIFTPTFTPRRQAEKPVKEKLKPAKKNAGSTVSIAEELDLRLPIAKKTHDKALKVFDQERYEAFSRRYLKQGLAADQAGWTQPLEAEEGEIVGALPRSAREEAAFFLRLRGRRILFLVSQWARRESVSGDDLLMHLHLEAAKKAFPEASLATVQGMIATAAAMAQAPVSRRRRPAPAPGQSGS